MKPTSVKKYRFADKVYNIVWKKPRKAHGICYAPRFPLAKRKILISPDLKNKKLLDTIIHEALHAELWVLDEESVYRTAQEIADLLWKFGYRLTDGNGKTISRLEQPALVKKQRVRKPL